MNRKLTGEVQIRDYLQALSPQLQKAMELSGLDTVETEALTAWASTVMESHSPSSGLARRMLMSGLRESSSTMNDDAVHDAVLGAMMQAMTGVRYGVVIKRPGKPAKARVYIGRQ